MKAAALLAAILAPGALAEVIKDTVCECPKSYIPVCGSDGVTYGNECELDCAARKIEDLVKVSDGKCPDECCSAEKPDCVCGSCFKLRPLEIVECVEGFSGKTCCTPQPPCSLEYAPVCGKDDQDYRNRCFAGSAGTSVACQGKCPCDKCCTAEKPDCACGSCTKLGPFETVDCAEGSPTTCCEVHPITCCPRGKACCNGDCVKLSRRDLTCSDDGTCGPCKG